MEIDLLDLPSGHTGGGGTASTSVAPTGLTVKSHLATASCTLMRTHACWHGFMIHRIGHAVARDPPHICDSITFGRRAVHTCGRRGRGWQRGQVYDDRFMNESRRIADPHRRHGSPARPYTARLRSKYPLAPLTLT